MESTGIVRIEIGQEIVQKNLLHLFPQGVQVKGQVKLMKSIPKVGGSG